MAQVWDAERIRKLRRRLGLTQAALGEQLAVSGSTVSHWENGYAAPGFVNSGRLEEIESALAQSEKEALELVHAFCLDCLIEDPSRSVPAGLMREVYREWCEERAGARVWTPDKYLGQLGLKLETPPGRRPAWQGVALKAWVNPLRKGLDSAPDPPPAGPGPQYAPEGGKLAAVAHRPAEEEVQPQARLHTRLRTKVEALTATLAHAGNQYAELMRVADEYELLLKEPTEKIDVVGLWSVGGALHEHWHAYREQQVDQTLAPPLEPQMMAALSSVVRDHGAFVLGFEEGRELVERADRFLLQHKLLAEIETPGRDLLDELATNRELVQEATRRVHAAIRDALHAADWGASRTTYAAYLAVRNAFRAIIHYSVGRDLAPLTIAGGLAGVSALTGDPNCEFLRAAIPVLQQHAAQLLAFFKHSPEFRAYVEWALDTLEHDRTARE